MKNFMPCFKFEEIFFCLCGDFIIFLLRAAMHLVEFVCHKEYRFNVMLCGATTFKSIFIEGLTTPNLSLWNLFGCEKVRKFIHF